MTVYTTKYAIQLQGLLREAVDHLAILADGEADDPDVGIFGWNDCHRVIAEARAALKNEGPARSDDPARALAPTALPTVPSVGNMDALGDRASPAPRPNSDVELNERSYEPGTRPAQHYPTMLAEARAAIQNDGPTLDRAIAYCKGQAMLHSYTVEDRAYDRGVAACVRMLEDMQPYPDEHLTERSPGYETLIEQLRDIANAYPENIFGPVTEQEVQANKSLITRNSAAMGRHLAPFMLQAADAIERLWDRLEKWRGVAHGIEPASSRTVQRPVEHAHDYRPAPFSESGEMACPECARKQAFIDRAFDAHPNLDLDVESHSSFNVTK